MTYSKHYNEIKKIWIFAMKIIFLPPDIIQEFVRESLKIIVKQFSYLKRLLIGAMKKKSLIFLIIIFLKKES